MESSSGFFGDFSLSLKETKIKSTLNSTHGCIKLRCHPRNSSALWPARLRTFGLIVQVLAATMFGYTGRIWNSCYGYSISTPN